MTAAWALILIIASAASGGGVATSTTYFANKDMCSAALKRVTTAAPSALDNQVMIFGACEVMGFNTAPGANQ